MLDFHVHVHGMWGTQYQLVDVSIFCTWYMFTAFLQVVNNIVLILGW